jgi:uncharacterized protein (TIGR03086 family)
MTSPSAWGDGRGVPDRWGDGPALLERAVGYTRTSLHLVAGTPLTAPTPCRGWDLQRLLRHMNDSLAAFTEAAEIGYVDLVPVVADDPARLLVDRLRGRACALVGAWTHRPPGGPVPVADREIPPDLLAAAGALEITVHGWDVAVACGARHPLPDALARELLDLLPFLITDDDRPSRFDHPVDVPLQAPASDRLLAALGRRCP